MTSIKAHPYIILPTCKQRVFEKKHCVDDGDANSGSSFFMVDKTEDMKERQHTHEEVVVQGVNDTTYVKKE